MSLHFGSCLLSLLLVHKSSHETGKECVSLINCNIMLSNKIAFNSCLLCHGSAHTISQILNKYHTSSLYSHNSWPVLFHLLSYLTEMGQILIYFCYLFESETCHPALLGPACNSSTPPWPVALHRAKCLTPKNAKRGNTRRRDVTYSHKPRWG